ncbi:MFS transporter [Fictibacillus sp. b24]|uniref:MFS transporter n=1 Tax=Fictibacillus sp. b24 TaxID=3055863 RepID=UPI0025A172C9|nr:MFS transporter [Fictibacillus sp. b24]MDM5317832.1 MFS transporter [Fictibacillus sp. b24]
MSVQNVFKFPHLVVLWISQLFSAIGDHLYVVAITWIAIQELGSSAAYVIGSGTFSSLFFGLLGGVYADRWNRFNIMIGTDLLRALFVALIPLIELVSEIHIWHLVLISVAVSGLGTFFNPSLQSSLPSLCKDPRLLQQTNALMDTTHRLARIFGPGLTGVFLLFLPLPHFFSLDSFTFVVSAIALTFIRKSFMKTRYIQSNPSQKRQTPLKDLTQAYHLLHNHKLLVWALISLGLVNLCWGAVYMVGVPLFTEKVLKESVAAFGLIGGAYGVGNIVSLFVVGNIKRNMIYMYIGHLILGVGFIVIASADTLWVALLGAVIAAFGSPMGDILLLTMIQTDFPETHIGKIYSFRALIGGLGLSLGTFLASFFYQLLPISVVMFIFSAIIIGVGLTGIIFLKRINLKPVFHLSK